MVKITVEKNIDVELEVNVGIRDVLAALPSLNDPDAVDEEGIPLKHHMADGINTVYQYMDSLTPAHFEILGPKVQETIIKAFSDLAEKLKGMPSHE